MQKIAIVTGSDEKYFDILWGLVRSLKYFEETRSIDCFVIDAGLQGAQLARLIEAGAFPVSVDWGFPFISRENGANIPKHLQCLAVRPFLPDMLPGYDVYVWMDGDTWVQSGDAVAEFVGMARHHDVAMVPEVHFSYRYLYDVSDPTKQTHYDVYQLCYGQEVAQSLGMLPVFNAGVFAARASSPLWGLWREEMAGAVLRARILSCDQASLNLLIYRKRLSVGMLPPEYNWICGLSLPAWDAAAKTLVSPGPLPRPIKVIHITGGALGSASRELACVQGGTVERSLRCPYPRVVEDP